MPDIDRMRKFYPKRTIINYHSFTLSPEVCYLLCLTDDQVKIIRAFLLNEGDWRTSYLDQRLNDQLYEMVTDEQFNYIQNIIADVIDQTRRDYQMACFDDLIAAIDRIGVNLSNAIYNTGLNCNGAGGTGVVEIQAETFSEDGVAYPTGYSSLSDYHDWKCNLAQMIIDKWIADFKALRQINVASYSLEAAIALLAITIISPLPFDELVAVGSLILALFSIAVSAYVEAIDEMISYLQDDLDICILFEATDATTAKTALQADIDNQTFTQDIICKQILKHFMGYDSLNLLFQEKPDNLNYDALPAGDCATCQSDPCWPDLDNLDITGTILSSSVNGSVLTVEVQSVSSAGYQFVGIGPFSQTCCWQFHIVSISGHSPGPGNEHGFTYSCDTITLSDHLQSLAAFEGCFFRAGIRGLLASQFTVTLELDTGAC